MRMIQIQDNISEQKNLKDKLESEQEKLHVEYNKVSCTIQTHRNMGLFLGQTDSWNVSVIEHICADVQILHCNK